MTTEVNEIKRWCFLHRERRTVLECGDTQTWAEGLINISDMGNQCRIRVGDDELEPLCNGFTFIAFLKNPNNMIGKKRLRLKITHWSDRDYLGT